MTHRYLNLTPLSRALAVMRQKFPPPGRAESVPLQLAVGRVTAEPIYAVYSVPMVDTAKFDGYAVRSGETLGAQDQRPLTLTNYSRINTGEVLPPAFDAVIMVEDTWEENGRVWIRKSAARGQNIRRAGEDIRAGELVLP
ncbi:MAG TPA: molybdenum cofactor biosynthesis protein, partial [Methanoculleus sp.]|nr:molybdenum cofactor biosynthesis protein [Methanoculleus sp.]